MAKADAVRELEKVLIKGTTIYSQRFFVSLPKVDAHSNHFCDGAAGFGQTVHPAIVQEIRNLALNGITKVTDVKAALWFLLKPVPLLIEGKKSLRIPTEHIIHPVLA
jgi:hypothetical protein